MATTTSWEELLGSKNWDTLLDPLDQSFRELILRCGDFCQATYDAFVNDQNSKYFGASCYGKSSFFDKVMLESASDYEVTSFLYATARVALPEGLLIRSQSRDSWDHESNWFGYIAITSDERTKALGGKTAKINPNFLRNAISYLNYNAMPFPTQTMVKFKFPT